MRGIPVSGLDYRRHAYSVCTSTPTSQYLLLAGLYLCPSHLETEHMDVVIVMCLN